MQINILHLGVEKSRRTSYDVRKEERGRRNKKKYIGIYIR